MELTTEDRARATLAKFGVPPREIARYQEAGQLPALAGIYDDCFAREHEAWPRFNRLAAEVLEFGERAARDARQSVERAQQELGG